LEVVEERAALADHLEQAAAAVMVLVIALEVLGEVRDPLGEERDLDLGRAGVGLVLPVLRDRLGLAYGGNGHVGLQSPAVAPRGTGRSPRSCADWAKPRRASSAGMSFRVARAGAGELGEHPIVDRAPGLLVGDRQQPAILVKQLN